MLVLLLSSSAILPDFITFLRHPKLPMIYCNSLILNLYYVMAQECDEVRKNRRRIGRLPFRLSTIRFQKNGMLVCCFSEAPEYLILSDLARRLRRKKARSAPLFGVFRAFLKRMVSISSRPIFCRACRPRGSRGRWQRRGC